MTRAEYLAELETHLAGRMPPERLEHVIGYYREYFDEAGPGREQQIIDELGAPEQLARRILGDKAPEAPARLKEPSGKCRGSGSLRTALLAVCAAPISIPLMILAVILVVAAVIVVAAVVISVIAGGAACIAAGFFAVGCGFSALFTGGFSTTMYFSGLGLLAMGVGVLLITGICILAKLCFKRMARLLGRLLQRKEA